MLIKRNLPHSIHFGMKKDDSGKYEAHAWIAAENKIVIGGESAAEFKEVAAFRY
jgi:hypothetical protein